MKASKLGVLSAAVFAMSMAVPVLAQNNVEQNNQQPNQNQTQDRGNRGNRGNNNGNNGNNGNNNGGRGNFDPAQMRQRIMDRLKEQLGATDEEIAVLQPRIEKVTTLQRDLASGRMSMFGGGNRGGRGGDRGGNNTNTDQPTSPVSQRLRELQTLLDNKDAAPDDIKNKLAELRDARTHAREDLTKAQAELKEVLTARQEAVLVTMGILE